MKRPIAVLAIILTLGLGITRPKPARASSTAETIGIAAACFAVYIGILLITTKLVYGAQDDSKTTVEDPSKMYRKSPRGAELATHCAQDSGGVTLACW